MVARVVLKRSSNAYPPFKHPRSRIDSKQSRQQRAKGHLAPEEIYLNQLGFGSLAEADFERPALLRQNVAEAVRI